MHISELPPIEVLLKENGENRFVVLKYSSFRSFLSKLDFSGEIDEVDYLKRHSDVARAISERRLASAKHHYLKSGYFEKRKVKILGARKPPASAGANGSARR